MVETVLHGCDQWQKTQRFSDQMEAGNSLQATSIDSETGKVRVQETRRDSKDVSVSKIYDKTICTEQKEPAEIVFTAAV